jgi:hypothetical protein
MTSTAGLFRIGVLVAALSLIGLGNLDGLASAASISAGGTQTCVADSAGVASCWGLNYSGQIGDGTEDDRIAPVRVAGLSASVSEISTGGGYRGGFSCAVASGLVKCWGSGSSGQLGNGFQSGSLVPVNAKNLGSGATSISAAGGSACAIVAGAASCWGWNGSFGKLGNDSTEDSAVPVGVKYLSSGVTSISVGGNHTCALKSGAAMCWGNGDHGRLGRGSISDSVVPVNVAGLSSGLSAISAGGTHTCAIRAGGAKCWGQNLNGALGNGSTTHFSTVPVDVRGLRKGVSAISAGGNHTCAVVSGAAKCWGDGYYGRLGNGSSESSTVPVSVIGMSRGVTSISAGDEHTCAIQYGTVKCWGYGFTGALGNNSSGNTTLPLDVHGLGCVLAAAGGWCAAPPSVVKPPRFMKAGRSVKLRFLSQSESFRLTFALRSGKRNLKSPKPLIVAPGTTSLKVKLPRGSAKSIRKSLRKNKRIRVTLAITPSSSAYKGRTTTIRVK